MVQQPVSIKMFRLARTVPLLSLCLLLPAVAAVLDFEEYMQRAGASKRRGDWQSAASQYAQAINHPDLPKAGAERSLVHLEYGRAVGALCQFGEAEKYLLMAREIADRAGSSSFASLYELGGISVAQRKFTDALGYFSQMAQLAAKEPARTAPPQLLADAWEKYAAALDATGKPDEAQQRRLDAQKLRDANPKAAVAGTTIAYAQRCAKP